ncbi:MAG TPA: hypothetical protein VHU22_10995 [Xanthobacteraceae bacterium]|jgi:hypothetical protein|nr:hypothetical protein [Xanthobacteraceae bacterium]
MKSAVYAGLAAFCLIGTSNAENITIIQKDFYGDSSGHYVNRDPETGCTITNNCNVALNGTDALPVLVNPWEPVSINILCTQVIFMPSAPVTPDTMFYAGDDWSPDIMAWGIPQPNGGGSAKMCYPEGTSFKLPAAADGRPKNKPGQNDFTVTHLDVHVQGGPSTVNYQTYLSVWYTKNPK